MPGPYINNGKQVLHTVSKLWAPYADAITEETAKRIAEALTLLDEVEAGLWGPISDVEPPPAEPAPTRAAPMQAYERNHADEPQMYGFHTVRQESDEYVCRCGTRWDVTEGEEHP